MPEAFLRCVQHVRDQGKKKSAAYAICTAQDAGGIKEYRRHEHMAKRAGRGLAQMSKGRNLGT